jgi:DNA polymerase/3'-5' exonuclease PolX
MYPEETIKPLCDNLKTVGSIRRKRPEIGDCDFVVKATDANWNRLVNRLKKC